jgi:photosystem II stability/assembly factor-like uncharacterized protein
MKKITPLFAAVFTLAVLFSFQSVPAKAGMGFWTQTGPDSVRATAIVFDPTNDLKINLATWGQGVYRSVDGGATWQTFSEGLDNPYLNDLIIDPLNPIKMFAATYGSGVYRSFDGGHSWEQAASGMTGPSVNCLALDPHNPGTIFAGTLNGIYRTLDGGDSWELVHSPGAPVQALAVDLGDPLIVYAATEGDRVHKSTDGGLTWGKASIRLAGAYVFSLALDPDQDGVVYGGTYNHGVFRSQSGGFAWQPVNQGLPTGDYVLALALNPLESGTVYAGTFHNGVYKSLDQGGQWQKVGDFSAGPEVCDLAVDPANPARLLAATGQGLFSITQLTLAPAF